MNITISKKWWLVLGVVLLLSAGVVILSETSYVEDYIDKTVVRQFNRMHYDSRVYKNTEWLGVLTAQNPCDMWVLQEIIFNLKPDFIVETGTLYGGSSLFFAMMLAQVNENGKVITVDIKPRIEKASRFDVFQKRVEVITGDSASPAVVDRIAQQVKGRKVLVTLDSLHTKEHVLKELKLYSKLVSEDSYLIVQDTNVNGNPVEPEHGPGPMEAVKEFLSENKDFEIDRSMEKHMLTYYPSGYLKRIR